MRKIQVIIINLVKLHVSTKLTNLQPQEVNDRERERYNENKEIKHTERRKMYRDFVCVRETEKY